MKLHRAARHLPLRLVTGAFILNSGLSKRSAPEDRAAAVHGFATGAYPQLAKVSPTTFTKALSAGEIGLGAALLTPIVPTRIAALGLAAFSGGLLRLYLKTPSLTKEDGIRPSEAGISVAKDIWMAGIAASLLIDSCKGKKRGRCHKRSQAKAAKAGLALGALHQAHKAAN